MKKVPLVFILLLFSVILKAQSKIDLGVFVGTSHYLGDRNKERLFYSPSLSFGAFYRMILNPRYAVKIAFTYAPIKGDDADFDINLPPVPDDSWATTIYDITAQFEFNFMKFEYSARKMTYSPYMSGGLGIALVNNSSTFSYDMVIPFGVGVKVNLSRRISGAVLWEFRKTFIDNLDDLENIPGSNWTSRLHNNDWYYFVGINLSYRINYFKTLCPAYDE
jgi:hypothetical protein